jgi:hypothetical protein
MRRGLVELRTDSLQGGSDLAGGFFLVHSPGPVFEVLGG